MKKSKQNKTQKNNNNVDSNEIARQIAIETIKDTEKFFQRIANFFSFLFIFSTDRILSYIPDHNRCFLNSAPSAAHK